jgi:hypothetical protein
VTRNDHRDRGHPPSSKKWKPAAAAERDEVGRLGALKSLQTGWQKTRGDDVQRKKT